ncbi:prion-inhibition and propagation-domain-containing protein [Jackrogersella minutella]|nr:prion-inhibition and propagation-domain-containing protein [Jackrogersella minutella]
MAEVFGTVATALSVAALFNNCVDCFEYIQLGRDFGRDYERCQLKLDIAKTRMSRWGRAVRINEAPQFACPHPDDVPSRQARAILEEIEQLFRTVQKASKRYEIAATRDELLRFGEKDMQPVARGLHNRLDEITSRRQKKTSLFRKAAWALYDGKNFDKLVREIAGFVDELENLYPTESDRRDLVEVEIEELNDEPTLTALQDAAAGTDVVLSDAVAKKLEVCGGRNYARMIQSEEQARIRVGNEWSEVFSKTWTGAADQTSNQAESIASRGTSAVHIGNSFGGMGIFGH